MSRPPGRPPLSEGMAHSVPLSFRLTPSQAEDLDRLRGPLSRSDFCRDAIANSMRYAEALYEQQERAEYERLKAKFEPVRVISSLEDSSLMFETADGKKYSVDL